MKRNEMVGWFSLGLNSSGIEEVQHFNDMRDAANVNGQVGKCDLIARWHVLMVRKSEVFGNKMILVLTKFFTITFINIFILFPRIPDLTSRGCHQGATAFPTS